jgi:hypothetical protein
VAVLSQVQVSPVMVTFAWREINPLKKKPASFI